MRQIYEPMFNQYGVDILLHGHVHSYERTNPVIQYAADPTGCAPTYITIGDGGNLEKARLSDCELKPSWLPSEIYPMCSSHFGSCLRLHMPAHILDASTAATVNLRSSRLTPRTC